MSKYSVLIFFSSIIYFLSNIFYIKISDKFNILKKKSEFNLHKDKVCNNGGIIFILFFFLNLLISYQLNQKLWNVSFIRFEMFFLVIAAFYIISIYDQFIGLHPIYRLILQGTLIFISLPLIKFPITNWIPLKLEYLIIIYLWVYIINVTNFIDGTDGMMTVNNIGVYINAIIFFYYTNNTHAIFDISIILTLLSVIFLIFNWPKAKIFIGDTGSIPLGYINGLILIFYISNGYYFFAASIFAYPLLDVTLTLIKKSLKKISPWARLYDYYFLKPVIKFKQNHFYVLKYIIFQIFISSISSILYFKYNNGYYLITPFIISIFLIYKFSKKNNKKKSNFFF